MQITLTSKCDIKSPDRLLRDKIAATQACCKEVLDLLIHVVEQEWDAVSELSRAQEKQRAVEILINATKKNPNPKYPAYKQSYTHTPAYLRRALITKAINIVNLWNANVRLWEENGKQGKCPRLSYRHDVSLTFYRDNMWVENTDNLHHTHLKLYDGHDWVWCRISLRKTDAYYIHRAAQAGELGCPSVHVHGRKVSLHYPVTYDSDLHSEEEGTERICAIDLGVNTQATCVIMEPDGTVLARKFIKLASGKALMEKRYGRLRKAQSKGSKSLRRKWRRVNDANEQLVRDTVREVLDFAVLWSAATIVCEYLDTAGKLSGSGKWRLHLWRKREVYHRLYDRCHVLGLRIHQVCAWGTSKYAHDGSGVVERGRHICGEGGDSLGLSYSWVRFSSGKMYHADLNAAMNIGARYFLRSLLKSCPVTGGSAALANVLGSSGGSTWTLSSLINYRRALLVGHCLEEALGREALCTVSRYYSLLPCACL